MEWIHRYLFADFWVPVWPNIAAAIIGALWLNWRIRLRQLRHHEALKQHVTDEVRKAREETP